MPWGKYQGQITVAEATGKGEKGAENQKGHITFSMRRQKKQPMGVAAQMTNGQDPNCSWRENIKNNSRTTSKIRKIQPIA